MNNTPTPKWKAAIFGRCPACGGAGAFKNVVKIADHCKLCGVDLKKYETADGPAFFAISFVGTAVGIGAGILEVVKEPPIWVHLALWIPVTLIASALVVRLSKTLMIAHQMDLANRKSYKSKL